jgi:glutamyl-tRNA reductase
MYLPLSAGRGALTAAEAPAPCRNAAVLVGSCEPRLDATNDPHAIRHGSTRGLDDMAASVQRGLPKGWSVLATRSESDELLDVIGHALERGAERLVVVPLLPQFSQRSTGRLLDTLYRCLGTLSPDLHVEVRSSWFDDTEYVSSLADLVRNTLERAKADPDQARALLIPGAAIRDDEAYLQHLLQTARLIAAELGWDESRVSVFDAALYGPPDSILPRGDEHARPQDVVVVSASLASQTTDLNLRLVRQLPADRFTLHMCDDARVHERFAKTLGMLIRRGRHAASPERCAKRPAQSPCPRQLLGDLFMIGVCIPGAVPARDDMQSSACSARRFLEIKRPHLEVLQLLRDLKADFNLPECWLFNTCHRFEFYSWFPSGLDHAARAQLIEKLRGVIGRGNADGVHVVQNQAAWNHLLRTAAGLNSGLIGDADVAEQLESGLRAAEYAGAAGVRSASLVRKVIETVGCLRRQTGWGRFTHRYTEIAMQHLPERMRANLAHGRITVLGGSTTAASLIEVLRDRYNVPAQRITVLYRGNRSGPLMNRFLAAVGPDRLCRVEDYHHHSVLTAVAEADVAFLAGDHREAVLSGPGVVAARGSRERPLDIVDFNTFGSINEADLPAICLHNASAIAASITAFNQATWSCPEFLAALGAAEEWMARHRGPATRPVEHAATTEAFA